MQPLIINQAGFLPYKTPFQRPFIVAGQPVYYARGFYLTLTTSDGRQARGEIAPLEGRSQENDRRVLHDLKEVCSCLLALEVPSDKEGLIAFLRGEPLRVRCPSVKFGVESAFFELAAAACACSLSRFLGADIDEVKTACLLQGSYDQLIADAKMLIQQGHEVFKVKVGDRNIPLDVKKIADVRKLLPHNARLRLDANGQWSLDEACLFCQLAGLEKIEFIEEPLKDMGQLAPFYLKTRMPVALDETLMSSIDLSQQEGICAYVLKPMLLGGIVATLDWIKKAEHLKKKVIISSCFESTVGLKVLASLACLTGEVPGLGTQRWLKNG